MHHGGAAGLKAKRPHHMHAGKLQDKDDPQCRRQLVAREDELGRGHEALLSTSVQIATKRVQDEQTEAFGRLVVTETVTAETETVVSKWEDRWGCGKTRDPGDAFCQ